MFLSKMEMSAELPVYVNIVRFQVRIELIQHIIIGDLVKLFSAIIRVGEDASLEIVHSETFQFLSDRISGISVLFRNVKDKEPPPAVPYF